MNRKNKGFTLVEMIIVVSIFTILLGIMVPSVNSIFGFRVQRAVNSIAAALDETKTEAMNRLVGEMKLEKLDDGYYISYYLDRGKASEGRVKQDQPEKIAPAGTRVILHITDKNSQTETEKEMKSGDSVIITYDREDGSFRPLQTKVMTQDEINSYLEQCTDIPFWDDGENYCMKIEVRGGYRVRNLTLNTDAGTYTITAG